MFCILLSDFLFIFLYKNILFAILKSIAKMNRHSISGGAGEDIYAHFAIPES